MSRLGSLTLQAALALAIGFSLISLPVVAALFDGMALLLSIASAWILKFAGYSIVRTVTELREMTTGWAVDVTSVCDGHGLVFAWAAIVTAVRPGWGLGLRAVVMGVLAIIGFNLVRIVVLASVLAHVPAGFEAVHVYVFPLLTAGLMLVLARFVLHQPVSWAVAGLAVFLAVIWFFVSDMITAWTVVPLANLMLSFAGPDGIGTIALRAPGWTVDSLLIARTDPLAFHMAGLTPTDFTLAVPVIFACALIVRPSWPGLVLAVALMTLAMVLAAVAAMWSVADANGVTDMAVRAGDGLRAVIYTLPNAALNGFVRLGQNVLVHLNLLVLPVLILICGTARLRVAQ
ncbi:MAG: hypothetical protein ABI459_03615 [Deltaproteobacteria bacterium]